jgi:hypothetical protein
VHLHDAWQQQPLGSSWHQVSGGLVCVWAVDSCVGPSKHVAIVVGSVGDCAVIIQQLPAPFNTSTARQANLCAGVCAVYRVLSITQHSHMHAQDACCLYSHVYAVW